jgi:hypothetical protein
MAGIPAADDDVLFMFFDLKSCHLRRSYLSRTRVASLLFSDLSRFLTVSTLIDLFDCRVHLLFVFALHWLAHCGFICLPDGSYLVRVSGSFKDLSSPVSLARSLNK